jgi:hypothetical protein
MRTEVHSTVKELEAFLRIVLLRGEGVEKAELTENFRVVGVKRSCLLKVRKVRRSRERFCPRYSDRIVSQKTTRQS